MFLEALDQGLLVKDFAGAIAQKVWSSHQALGQEIKQEMGGVAGRRKRSAFEGLKGLRPKSKQPVAVDKPEIQDDKPRSEGRVH